MKEKLTKLIERLEEKGYETHFFEKFGILETRNRVGNYGRAYTVDIHEIDTHPEDLLYERIVHMVSTVPSELVHDLIKELRGKGYRVLQLDEAGTILTTNMKGMWVKSFKISTQELNERTYSAILSHIEERVHISEALYR